METILRVEDLEKEGILDRISFEMARQHAGQSGIGGACGAKQGKS